MIADNRLTENADWDDRFLGELLKELSLEDLDFSIEDTGAAGSLGCMRLCLSSLRSTYIAFQFRWVCDNTQLWTRGITSVWP